MNFKIKNSWWILNVYRKMCQFHVWATTRSSLAFALFCKYYGGCSNVNLRQLRSIKIAQNFLIESLLKQKKKIFLKNTTRLFCFLKNNYGNFCSILSNKVSNSSQDNALSECHHLSNIFYLKFAVMKGQTWENIKTIYIWQVDFIKPYRILRQIIYICISY